MRTTIEQKVVEMKFKNEEFEKNVQKTLSSLDKLKEKLKLNEATKGFEQLTAAANKFNLTGVTNTIDTIRTKFSAMEVVGLAALTKIANKAISAGGNIASALTIDPIKTGFNEYETKINAIQTILSNTSNKGTTMDDVTKTLNELNEYADKTIYNFAEMTRNIGTFTAAGIGLKDSATSIQGIANLAAASGSTSQQASTAMYQLSQAMAAGTVKLMDWNSVVNAGMGGQKFQEALKATAREHGIAVDAIIKKNGSFRESLQDGWITAEILNDTLNKFTVKGATDYANSMMKAGKWTRAQADALIKEAQSMEDAATKVKTFTQLWSTLQESAQSGWAQSWEIIIGNFEEARDLLTSISDRIGGVINRSAESRNAMLQGWKDLGGRQHIVDALTNTFEALSSILKPIGEAFREIFPPMTSKQLSKFTEGIKNLTARFKISDKTAEKLKTTFKGVFAVVDIAVTVVKALAKGIYKLLGNFTGLIGPILTGTSTLGEFASNLRNSVKESDFFGKAIDKIVGFLQNGIDKIKEFGASVKEGFKTKGYEGFVGFIKGLWHFLSSIGDSIMKVFGGIGESLANMFGKGSFLDLINSGVFTALLVDIFKKTKDDTPGFLEQLQERLVGDKSALAGITNILNSVKDCFKAYQEQLKAGTLMKIASAIGVLAASLFVVSTIDEEKLGKALRGIGILFVELLGGMALFSKMPDMKGVFKAIPLMLSMATSILILAGAMKIIGSMDPVQAGIGLLGIAGGLTALVVAANKLPKQRKFQNASKAIRSMSISLVILAAALKIMGSMDITEMGIALGGVLGGLALMVAALWALPKDLTTRTVGMISMAIAMTILAKALKTMGAMDITSIGKAMLALFGTLTAVTAALNFMPKNMISMGIGLIGVATALIILSKALGKMGAMSGEQIGKGLIALGGALIILSAALWAMKKSLAGAGALLVASMSLSILAGVLTKLGDMKTGQIVKALLTLVGAFAIIGIAAAVLAPIAPALLALSGSFALFGLAAVALGVGLGLVATGITLLGGALAAGAAGIVAGLTALIVGILQLVPAIVDILIQTVIGLAVAIGKAAPTLVASLFKLLVEVMKSLMEYTPLFARYLIDFVIGILDVATEKMPELVSAVGRFVGAFFGSVADAISNFDGGNFLKGVIAVGLMSAMVYALAGVSSLIAPAMLGLAGIGVLLVELAFVLGLIGKLNSIDGLAEDIEAAGNILEKIGTVIGQLIGGIIGGIAQGFTNSLPAIAEDLSTFMKDIQPFVDGARDIDKSVITGIKNLILAMSAVTLSGFGQKIADFLTIGKTPIEKFSSQLVVLGLGMKLYSKAIDGVDSAAISASAKAAKGLTEVARAIPKSSGIFDIFTGSDSMALFALQLVPFGVGLKAYGEAVNGVDSAAISASAEAAKGLTDVANAIPNSGGLVTLFSGDNNIAKFGEDLVTFGKGLKGFSEETAGIVPENIKACSEAAKNLAEMANAIPDQKNFLGKFFTGDNTIATFASRLKPLGKGLKEFSTETAGIAPDNIKACSEAAKALAEMADIIPDEKGFLGKFFTGDNTITTFADRLKTLGKGLKDFSTETAGIDITAVSAATEASKSLADMVSIIPKEKGIKAWFGGEDSIANFSNNLKPLGTGLKDFASETADIKPESVTAAATAAKSIADMVSIIPKEKGIKAWFGGEDSVANFAGNLKPLGTGLKDFAAEIGEVKPESVTAAANAAKALAEMAEIAPKNTDKIIPFGTNLVTFGGKLKSYFEKLTGVSAETIKVSKDAIDSIKTSTTGFNSETITGAADAISRLVVALKNMTGVSTESIKGFTDAMTELGKLEVKTISDSFNTAGTQLEEIGKNIITRIITGIHSKDPDMVTAGTDSATKLGEGLSATNEKLDTACETLVTKSAEKIKSYKNKFYNAGGYLVEGFANGITADTYKAEAAAAAMAKAAAESARRELRINSPSKIFKEIGSGVPEGFVQGISSFGSSIKNSVADMGNAAISSTKTVLSRIADAIDMDIDSQPTIRPVLDLSDIQSGASSINGMFNNIGIGANLNAINSSMNARLQNGNNDDVVSAIGKLGKSLGNVRGDTYNINGVAVDDEGSVKEAVQTIIRAAIVGRRV